MSVPHPELVRDYYEPSPIERELMTLNETMRKIASSLQEISKHLTDPDDDEVSDDWDDSDADYDCGCENGVCELDETPGKPLTAEALDSLATLLD